MTKRWVAADCQEEDRLPSADRTRPKPRLGGWCPIRPCAGRSAGPRPPLHVREATSHVSVLVRSTRCL